MIFPSALSRGLQSKPEKKKYRALHDGAEGRLQRNGVTTNIFSAIRDKIKHKKIDNCTSYTYLLARQLVGHCRFWPFIGSIFLAPSSR